MSEPKTCSERIESLLSMKFDDEQAIIANLDQLVEEFGIEEVQRLCIPKSRQKNLLLHEFVRLGLLKTIEHAVSKLGFNVNIQRESDENTSLHLAYWYKNPAVGELLKQLQADVTIKNKYGESVSDLERTRESMMNIIWLDTGKIKYSIAPMLKQIVFIKNKFELKYSAMLNYLLLNKSID